MGSNSLGRFQSSQSVSSKGSSLPRYSTKSKDSKGTLKNRLLEAKMREEVSKRKHKEKLYRRKLISKQRRVQEELEYLHFPTILGWYFDGFFQHHFSLNQEWADIFNAIEEEYANQKELHHLETFTEMTQRNFWPPKVYGRLVFRTRGLYLDLREVIRDPPHTPPDTNFETNKDEDDKLNAPEWEFSTLDDTDDSITMGLINPYEDELRGQEMEYGDNDNIRAGDNGPRRVRYGVIQKPNGEEINRHDYYFDEDVGEFFYKHNEEPINFYFDSRYNVWRHKKPIHKYNGDWYFDDLHGMYILKDRSQSANIYYFDNIWKLWKKREVYGPSKNGLTPKDYYYDELESEWYLKKDTTTTNDNNTTYSFDENGWRSSIRIPLNGPDDYYFDEYNDEYNIKEEGESKLYIYDPSFGAWRKIGGLNHKRIYSPNDFYWNEQQGIFEKKDGPKSNYEFDNNNKFFRKKKLLDGLHNPKNWIWENKKKLWVPKRNNRSNIFSQILNWRPPREYDKPWLDYIGMNVRGKRKNNKKQIESDKPPPPQEGDNKNINKPSTSYEPPTKTLAQILADHGADSEWGDESFKTSSKRIPFDSKGDQGNNGFQSNRPPPPGVENPNWIGPQETTDISESRPIKIEEIVDRTIDRKRLRCGNLNGLVNGKELKAFFVSATTCTKPKEKNNKDKDDFMYIQFESDQATAAAIRTMQHADIKGQKIELSYPRRYQK